MDEYIIRESCGRKHKGKIIKCFTCGKELFVRLNQKHTGYCKSCFGKKIHETYRPKITKDELCIEYPSGLRVRAKKINCKNCKKELLTPKGKKHTGYCHDCNSSKQGINSYKNGIAHFREKAIAHYGSYCQVCKKTENIEVHHIDFKRKNNKIQNLMPLCRDCHKLKHSGDFGSNSKLTCIKVLEIRKLYPKTTIAKLAKIYGVGKTTIGHIVNYRTWKDVK